MVMKSNKYPRFGGKRKYSRYVLNGGTCECCLDKTMAVGRVDVQVSYMRGEDEVFRVCQHHMDMAVAEEFDTFFSDYHAKHNSENTND